MFFRKTMILVSALALLFGMSSAVAQDKEKKGNIAQVVMITAKEGHSKELESAITEYHHFMGKKPGAMRWQWYEIMTGPDTGKYLARTGDHNWADFDAEHDWDDESGAKFTSLVQPHVESAVRTFTSTNDIGNWPESMDGYEYFSVSHWYINPGQSSAFYEGLKKATETLKANNFPGYYGFINVVSGGMGNAISLVIPYKNYADMVPIKPGFMDIMNKAMGEDKAKAFVADWGSTYKAGDNRLLHYLAKQSDYGDGK